MTEIHRLLIAIVSICLYLLWVAVLFFKHKKQTNHAVAGNEALVVYASQTGTAEKIARAKAAALSQQERTSVVSMASLTLHTLSAVSKVIFVVSTYGEGEPPDAGRAFSKALKKASSNQPDYLSHLSFEVVGLGDKQYAAYCQFAVTLFDNISALGARALSPLMTLDSGKGEHLSLLGSLPKEAQQPTQAFTLKTRIQLNKNNSASRRCSSHIPTHPANIASSGLFGLSLSIGNATSTKGLQEQWEAGDVLEVILPHGAQQVESAAVSRSYTIASVPQERDVKLVVRQLIKDDGQRGLGSGLLTHTLPLSQSLQAYIRKNTSANITDTQCPLVLIAAGSGIAGVRAQLAKRALLENAGPVWIFFGERHPTQDDVLDITLSPFQYSDCIFKKSVIFSRQKEGGGYVQERLIKQREEVKSFLGESGQVYVCGHFEGMGQSVDTALRSVLGERDYNALASNGRYHRDLY